MNPYQLAPMTEQHAAEIGAWRYPPSYERYAAEGKGLADGSIRAAQFRSVMLNGELCGFVQWFPLVAEDGACVIRLGIGLKPELCGKGLGAGFTAFLAAETARHHPNTVIDLEVASDNPRAIKAYERAGFRRTDEYTVAGEHVICMEWHAAN